MGGLLELEDRSSVLLVNETGQDREKFLGELWDRFFEIHQGAATRHFSKITPKNQRVTPSKIQHANNGHS